MIAIAGEIVQLMDMETYQTFEISMPLEDEIKNKLAPGVEVEYWSMLGRNKIVRVKG